MLFDNSLINYEFINIHTIIFKLNGNTSITQKYKYRKLIILFIQTSTILHIFLQERHRLPYRNTQKNTHIAYQGSPNQYHSCTHRISLPQDICKGNNIDWKDIHRRSSCSSFKGIPHKSRSFLSHRYTHFYTHYFRNSHRRHIHPYSKIGRASCRERV